MRVFLNFGLEHELRCVEVTDIKAKNMQGLAQISFLDKDGFTFEVIVENMDVAYQIIDKLSIDNYINLCNSEYIAIYDTKNITTHTPNLLSYKL